MTGQPRPPRGACSVPDRAATLGAPSTEQDTEHLRLGFESAHFYLTKIWDHCVLFECLVTTNTGL